MKYPVHFLSILAICLFISINLNSQVLNKNNCDRSVLSEKEYVKCLEDSAWNYDIIAKTNYISFIKTELLPKFRQKRKQLKIPEDLTIYLTELKILYDSSLKNKTWSISKEMEKNQYYIQPKAYISSILSFEVFKFYPDIYAVLLNIIPSWTSFNNNLGELEKIDALLKKIKISLPQNILSTAKDITTEMEKERLKYKEHLVGDFLQGSTDEQSRQFYSIINFLIWNE